MEPDKPHAERIPSSVTDPEESAEAIILTRLKLVGPSAKPRLRAITSDCTQAIAQLWRIESKLPHSRLILDAYIVEEVSISVMDSLNVPRQHGEGQAEK